MLQINFSDLPTSSDDFGKIMYSFPVSIRVLIGVVLFFSFVITVLFAFIIGSRINKTHLLKKNYDLRKKFQPMLTGLLFEDDDRLLSDKTLNIFEKKDLENEFNRNVLLDEIIHLHENFTGEIGTRLELLYRKLGFQKESISKLNSRRWYVNAKGLRELALMNITESIEKISTFIKSKNEILRMEARVALVKLNQQERLSFLDKETETLSAWDQANLHSMLEKLPRESIPDFTKWINSSNRSVVKFSVSMTGAFKQSEAIQTLIHMLDYETDDIKKVIIKSLRELSASEAEEKFIAMYKTESGDVKNEILTSLETIATEKSVPLFEKILNEPVTDYHTVIHAIRAMSASGGKGRMKLDLFTERAGEQMRNIILHAADERL